MFGLYSLLSAISGLFFLILKHEFVYSVIKFAVNVFLTLEKLWGFQLLLVLVFSSLVSSRS